MARTWLRAIAVSLWTMLLCNCINDTVSLQYRRLGLEGWERSDTLVFDLPEMKEGGEYLPSVLIRTGNLFPYSKLWLCYELELECPKLVLRDTMCVEFASQDVGIVTNGLIVRKYGQSSRPVCLTAGQRGRVRIYHLMMQEVMPGIMEVGTEIRRGH